MEIPQARFWVQALFLFSILIFCMLQLFLQVQDRAVYIALLSAICGNTVPTIKQKKHKNLLHSFDDTDGPPRRV